MEYRIAKGWRITGCIVGAALIITGIGFMGDALIDSNNKGRLAFAIIGILMALGGWLLIRSCINTKLTIEDDSITMQTGFGTRTLLLNEIKGYRRVEKQGLMLVPETEGSKPLKISDSLQQTKEIEAWLQSKYPDLDAVDYAEETNAILADETFGSSEEERQATLQSARQIAQVGNAVAFVTLFWTIIYPKPYELCILLLLLLPFVAFYITWKFKGLMRMDEIKKSAYPSVVSLILLPCLGLCIRALIDYNIYDHHNVWQPVIVIGVVITAVAAWLCNKALQLAKNRMLLNIGGLIIFFAYAYGATILMNGYQDTSKAQEYKVNVTGKHFTSGKSTTYYLELESWGKFTTGESFSVPHDLYNRVKEGDTVRVLLKQGKLNIPWFWITDDDTKIGVIRE